MSDDHQPCGEFIGGNCSIPCNLPVGHNGPHMRRFGIGGDTGPIYVTPKPMLPPWIKGFDRVLWRLRSYWNS